MRRLKGQRLRPDESHVRYLKRLIIINTAQKCTYCAKMHFSETVHVCLLTQARSFATTQKFWQNSLDKFDEKFKFQIIIHLFSYGNQRIQILGRCYKNEIHKMSRFREKKKTNALAKVCLCF